MPSGSKQNNKADLITEKSNLTENDASFISGNSKYFYLGKFDLSEYRMVVITLNVNEMSGNNPAFYFTPVTEVDNIPLPSNYFSISSGSLTGKLPYLSTTVIINDALYLPAIDINAIQLSEKVDIANYLNGVAITKHDKYIGRWPMETNHLFINTVENALYNYRFSFKIMGFK